MFSTPQSSHTISAPPSATLAAPLGPSQPQTGPLADSPLAIDALRILRGTTIDAEVEQQLIDLFHKYDLRTQGIARGRDITRLALQQKQERIAELEARVTTLEDVVSHLKRDIVESSSPRSHRRGRSNNS